MSVDYELFRELWLSHMTLSFFLLLLFIYFLINKFLLGVFQGRQRGWVDVRDKYSLRVVFASDGGGWDLEAGACVEVDFPIRLRARPAPRSPHGPGCSWTSPQLHLPSQIPLPEITPIVRWLSEVLVMPRSYTHPHEMNCFAIMCPSLGQHSAPYFNPILLRSNGFSLSINLQMKRYLFHFFIEEHVLLLHKYIANHLTSVSEGNIQYYRYIFV